MKQRPNQASVNKNQILQWINTILDSNQTKIQSLGNGIVYCLLMNHFYPNSIPKNKIVTLPRNNMDNKTNLRKVQDALALLNIKSITFDIFRVSQMSYLDNWQLISKFYRHFQEFYKNNQKDQQNCNHSNESQQLTNTSQREILNHVHQSLNPSHHIYTLPKQISKTPDFSTGMLTPMKGLKYFDQNTKLRCQALKLMQEIKTIVKSECQSDKLKVKNLKKMLGLIDEQSQEDQLELKELFSDCKKKQQVITID